MFNNSLEILKKIESYGFEAYIVGGFARDKYIDRKSTDVDICTNATPKDLKNIFKESMLPKEQYGSVTVIYKKVRYDITTYRRDIKYENNRLPVEIKYINDLKEDLMRRDFIINTLCINSKGEFVDLLNAKKDLDKKIIITVGDPNEKLSEDALRILRAIRFATILDFDLEEDLKNAIKRCAPLLEKLSYYRKKEELDKIFSSINVKKGIDLILEFNLDKYLDIENLRNITLTTSSIGIWTQLNVLNKYSFSNVEQESIRNVSELCKKDVFTNYDLYSYGLYYCSIVAEIKHLNKVEISKRYMSLPIKNRKEIAIDGNKICKYLNINPSSILRTILDDIENKIINNQLINDKKELMNYVINKYNIN